MNDEQFEKIIDLSMKVMKVSRNTLVVNLRFLDSAISNLKCVPVLGLDTYAVDGRRILYNPVTVLKNYKDEKNAPVRGYMHMVLHCVFRHFFVNTLVDQEMWDLACDIAVENMITELQIGSLDVEREGLQHGEIRRLKDNLKFLSAEKIYNFYQDNPLTVRKKEMLKEAFTYDDHYIWYEEIEVEILANESSGGGSNSDESEENESSGGGSNSDESEANESSGGGSNSDESEENESSGGESNSDEKKDDKSNSQNTSLADQQSKELQQLWKDISEHIQMDMESFSKKQGDVAGSMMQNLTAVNREKYDYTSFLKKFATMGEVMKINDDEFDYIFYTYGMNMYGNMPLIEPLEYKEVKRIKEFVIAIDTSGSVAGELVQKFVQKTYNILMQEESFFSKVNIHIIQCDTQIQEDVKVTNKEEFEKYMENMTIKGLGGTDFRPVFEYVDEMIRTKEYTNLKGLIYFTDGWGTFPSKQPDYHTAVIYVDDDYNNPDVPVWAIKLALETEDLKNM